MGLAAPQLRRGVNARAEAVALRLPASRGLAPGACALPPEGRAGPDGAWGGLSYT